jgi:hypothetical protein
LAKLDKLTGGGSYKKAEGRWQMTEGKKTYFAFYAFSRAYLSPPRCAV